jgi:hypothetical protein
MQRVSIFLFSGLRYPCTQFSTILVVFPVLIILHLLPLPVCFLSLFTSRFDLFRCRDYIRNKQFPQSHHQGRLKHLVTHTHVHYFCVALE